MNYTYKLGNIKLKNRIFLAPMHEVNDIVFRILCKKAGAEIAYTGLINPQTKESLVLDDQPVLQIACNSKKGIKEFIKKYDKKVLFYDFNLGCPSKRSDKNNVGYFLTKNPKEIELILKEIKKYTKKPLTIKIRMMAIKKTKEIIKIAEKYCNAISIHPRTLEQGYSGFADIAHARKIKDITNLPIIYSGDIKTKEQADKVLEEFDFIMIGREAIGNPSIFSELINKKLKHKLEFKDYLQLAEKYKLDFKQIKFQAINFTKGFKGAKKIRQTIMRSNSLEELKDTINYS